MTEYETILVERDETVAIVKINRPKAMNALNSKVLLELYAAFKEIEEDKEVLAVVLTGEGEKAFVAGADIAEMADLDPSGGREFAVKGHTALGLIEKFPRPVIAAVNGFALGGGTEVAMACDIRLASEKAKFGQPEVGLGIIPGFGGTQRLMRLVGEGMAKELIFRGNIIKADEALRIGLVQHVYPPEELMPKAVEMAKEISTKGPLAVSTAKSLMNEGLDLGLTDGLSREVESFRQLFGSHDQKEGMKAFLEKRPPDFKAD